FLPLRLIRMVVLVSILVAVTGFGYVVYLSQNQSGVSGVSSPHYQGSTNQKMVSLTFNVDWGEEFLPQLLKILKDEEIQATFFVTGRWAERQPDLVKQIVKDGHDLGNHGHGHRHLKNLSNQELAGEITAGEKVLQNISGQKPRLYAPAYGEVDERISRVASQLGYEVIMWSLDTIDWQNPDVATIVKRVVPRIHNDAIILMHPTRPTVEALPQIIKQLKKEGYRMVPVSRLISATSDNKSDKDTPKNKKP
ncbi:MAG: polysaccharide deacetylase family protein, partial [Bacillota bacterium]